MRLRIPIATLVVIASIVVVFVWAPIVPFESQQNIEVPNGTFPCPGSLVCPVSPKMVYVRGYGSLAYDAFGFGTSPFTAPVSAERNGVVTDFLFNQNGTVVLASAGHPASTSEPFPILKVNGLTFYPHGAPFGGAVSQLSVTNLGTGETAEVTWYFADYALSSGQSKSTQIPAGGTALINSTTWVGNIPGPNMTVVVRVQANLYYPKVWLVAFVNEAVVVTYSS